MEQQTPPSRTPPPPTAAPVGPAAAYGPEPGGTVPRHVAIIMDGNGRWAEGRGLPRTEGHRQGEERLADIVRTADDLGIRWLTAYGFSTENWTRPKLEVDFILSLHKNIFGRLSEMHRNNVRIRCVGRAVSGTSRLPRRIQKEIARSVRTTESNTGLNFTLAFDYGAREELVFAVRNLLQAHAERGVPLTEASLAQFLYEPALPPVDLLVRTSGEQRYSNFLLWQAVDAPFYVTPTFWPDFDRNALEAALAWWRAQRHVQPGDPDVPERMSPRGDWWPPAESPSG